MIKVEESSLKPSHLRTTFPSRTMEIIKTMIILDSTQDSQVTVSSRANTPAKVTLVTIESMAIRVTVLQPLDSTICAKRSSRDKMRVADLSLSKVLCKSKIMSPPTIEQIKLTRASTLA